MLGYLWVMAFAGLNITGGRANGIGAMAVNGNRQAMLLILAS